VDFAAVTHIDGSAVQALKQLQEEYKSRNIQVSLFCEAAIMAETVLNGLFQCAKFCESKAEKFCCSWRLRTQTTKLWQH
jgi:anti-anti-sigma regulatory factor